MSKYLGVEENRLNKLIEQCKKCNAEILSVDIVNGTGLVELSNGTPSSVYFDIEKQEWL